MATVGITIGMAVDGFMPAHAAVPAVSEAITSSGTSQTTTGAVTHSREAIKVTASGGAVWVAVGSAPTAAAGNDHLVPDGATLDLVHLLPGWKVAVIDA
jgi:hypothetical protein